MEQQGMLPDWMLESGLYTKLYFEQKLVKWRLKKLNDQVYIAEHVRWLYICSFCWPRDPERKNEAILEITTLIQRLSTVPTIFPLRKSEDRLLGQRSTVFACGRGTIRFSRGFSSPRRRMPLTRITERLTNWTRACSGS